MDSAGGCVVVGVGSGGVGSGVFRLKRVLFGRVAVLLGSLCVVGVNFFLLDKVLLSRDF